MCLLFLNFSNVRQDLTNQSKLYGNFCSDDFPFFLSICCVPCRILTTLHLFCAVSLTWNQSKCKFRFILCVVISLLTDTFREFLIEHSYKLILHNTDMFFFFHGQFSSLGPIKYTKLIRTPAQGYKYLGLQSSVSPSNSCNYTSFY